MDKKTEAWNNLKITSNFVFAKVMQNNEICIKVLEMLLNFEIGDIKSREIEKVIDIAPTAKGVRLDVYVKTEDKTYNVEMQVVDNKNLPKRSRYYQGMIDMNTIEKGQLYEELKDSYVIFICTFDPLGKSMPVYTFENFCREDKELCLNDRAYKIFFNSECYSDIENEDLKNFMAYVHGVCNKNNSFVNQLDEKVSEIKSSEKWRDEFMNVYLLTEESFADGKKMGKAEGKAEGKIEGEAIGIKLSANILGLFEKGFAPDIIAKEQNITYQKVVEVLTAFGKISN